MNAETRGALAADLATLTVDERNPWLGLASFTEETRGYFYGRDEEIAELARRVQRKLLTVLFGQSGLGKTSILRAGLVPRLRAQGYCPMYVRIAYGRDAPEPAAQIKQVIQRSARSSGRWTQAGVAVEGESLWEFLHHRDDVLHDEQGATLIPLLIFDQFEEIFTLAQSDDFGRARAARFIADLADLVENRPPKELEARLEHDDSATERFDFARSDYRVLIALREDYLAPLEGLKAAMPSITQNRLRLAPMTGQQALAAVTRPGKRLVNEEVAEAIVRFVAGGAELANAEVEPSLLSLICRELNDTRLAEGRGEISLDLLAGSHATILAKFYERSLADQPAAVRCIIEDELLTESGFRENVAEERLLSDFSAAGAAPDALAKLVNRRLLRIEERLDIRRVELTHDVLCSVVKSSRDLRQEREARDATERLLAEQRGRELAARRALVRARQVAAVCIVLAVGALVAAALAYLSTQRARSAERQAQQAHAAADETRILAEQARGQAEQLLSYLSDDFSRELESFGRLDVVAELAKRQVDYFKALPAELKGADTRRNGAQAMVHYARAMRGAGKVDPAGAAAAEAIELLNQLRQGGDQSEATTIALASATSVQAVILDSRNDAESLPTVARAVELLKPIAEAPNASLAARRAYVESLDRYGFKQLRADQFAAAIKTLELCRRIASGAGAADLTSPDMAAESANCSAWQVEALTSSGRDADSRRLASAALAAVERVVAVRPNYLLALRAQDLLQSGLGSLKYNDMQYAQAIAYDSRAVATARRITTLDPGNAIQANNLAVDLRGIADALWQSGHPRESLVRTLEGEVAYNSVRRAGESFTLGSMFGRFILSLRQAELGDIAATRPVIAEMRRDLEALRHAERPDPAVLAFGGCVLASAEANVALRAGDRASAQRLGQQCLDEVGRLTLSDSEQRISRAQYLYFIGNLVADAAYQQHDDATAERSLRAALVARDSWPLVTLPDRRDVAGSKTLLALILARQGKRDEARQLIAPVVAFEREAAPRGREDAWLPLELAAALEAAALAGEGDRSRLLDEAQALVAALPAGMHDLWGVRLWRDRIREAQGAPAAAPPAPKAGAGD